MLPTNGDRARRHRNATSRAMKRMAEARRCPKCRRGNAISKRVDVMGVDRWCRYCAYEKHTPFPMPSGGVDSGSSAGDNDGQ